MIERAIAAAVLAVLLLAPVARADDPTPPPPVTAGGAADDPDPRFAMHAQLTNIWQYHPAFNSPYQGTNSLDGGAHTNETFDASFILGASPWKGAEVWGDLDVNQGFAPSNTEGVAGYVNGDGAKVGRKIPYGRLQRMFFRQTIDLGGGDDADVDADMLQFAQKQTKDRLVITVGKFSVTDVFDDNKYAHDPKHDFLNWALIDTGSFDYAADAWGFSTGAALEWYTGPWTLRGGFFDLSKVPNGAILTSGFGQFQLDAELERRQSWFGKEGKIKLLVFANRGDMGTFADALRLAALTGDTPDTGLVRHYRTRPGVSVNIEQPITDDFGFFIRAGVDDGRYESYEYTDIDQTVAGGVSLAGNRWGRKDDTVGAALIVNGISSQHQAYLNAGGLGILVGDGKLPHPGAETILEAYYSLAVIQGINVSFDSQSIVNPAYNRDRGPAEVLGLRLHGQF